MRRSSSRTRRTGIHQLSARPVTHLSPCSFTAMYIKPERRSRSFRPSSTCCLRTTLDARSVVTIEDEDDNSSCPPSSEKHLLRTPLHNHLLVEKYRCYQSPYDARSHLPLQVLDHAPPSPDHGSCVCVSSICLASNASTGRPMPL